MDLRMTHTFHHLFYHLVWSTKNREPLIAPAVEQDLYTYLSWKVPQLGGNLLEINGIEDHLHLLIQFPPKWPPAKIVKDLKGSSSHYLSHRGTSSIDFQWQEGYSIFSVGERETSFVRTYIQRQKQHHREGNLIDLWETTAPKWPTE